MSDNNMIFPDTRHPTPDIWMQHALTLARAQLGQTWPNPTVGCVIIKNEKIIGEGATAKNGRPHAETIALTQAGEQAPGATLYVTLEPCSHHGKTPPCADAIIAAGIVRVVIACRDPNPLVNGQGIAKLKAEGIEIIESICEEEAREINRGFFSVLERKRPYIAMKIATSSDGMIASSSPSPLRGSARVSDEGWGGGENSSQNTPLLTSLPQGGRKYIQTQITGEQSRHHTHQLRAEFDAILTGIGTVLADDPQLTVRIAGQEHRSPVRVVLDSQGRLPANAKIQPAWVFGRNDNVIQTLTERGITRLLIEGGQQINTHFLTSGMVDRIYHYQAPHAIGAGGLPAIQGSFSEFLEGWQCIKELLLGDDILRIYERKMDPMVKP